MRIIYYIVIIEYKNRIWLLLLDVVLNFVLQESYFKILPIID